MEVFQLGPTDALRCTKLFAADRPDVALWRRVVHYRLYDTYHDPPLAALLYTEPMSWPDHPPTIGQHPWLDPLSPPDIFNPRPDSELAIAGALAPPPDAFPFTEAGRQEYYDAVRAAAQQQVTMQHQHMAYMYAQAEAQAEAARQQAERDQNDDEFLLML